jgi:hypothetical protein
VALTAALFVSVLAPAITVRAFAWSCWPEANVNILSIDGNNLKETNAKKPVIISAEFDNGNGCRPDRIPNAWIIEARNSDGVEFVRWQSISSEDGEPYRIKTQWVPARGDNYEINAKVVIDMVSYCSSIETSHRDYKYCKDLGPAVFLPAELGRGKANLVVLGDLKGIMRDLRVTDRFDVGVRLAKIPVNLDSIVQVTLTPFRWPATYPSLLSFEIYDSKGKLVHTKLVHNPDTFSGVDWTPSKAGKYTIKATLTDSLTEPKMSTHVVKTVRVFNK